MYGHLPKITNAQFIQHTITYNDLILWDWWRDNLDSQYVCLDHDGHDSGCLIKSPRVRNSVSHWGELDELWDKFCNPCAFFYHGSFTKIKRLTRVLQISGWDEIHAFLFNIFIKTLFHYGDDSLMIHSFIETHTAFPSIIKVCLLIIHSHSLLILACIQTT